jgi:beta-lactamase superfamily II metal-dependent hydrolase
VAVLIRIGGLEILLGSDLERSANPQIGWKAVLNATNVKPFAARIVKVAHHGSETGDEPDVWTQRIGPEPWALLTRSTEERKSSRRPMI